MRRLFNVLFGALAMIAVALVSAFISMRLAIHGREVTVPSLTGLTVSEAEATTAAAGLTLSMQNRFYSTAVPSGHILTQSPAPGTIVRRDSQLRVAESLGGQLVTIPNLIGKPERAASLVLRRLALDVGTVAHLPLPASAPVGKTDPIDDTANPILAQSPSPNSAGASSPRVSFLLADPEPPSVEQAYVMPSLIGLNLVKASALLASVGLRLSYAEESSVATAPAVAAPAPPTSTKAAPDAKPAASLEEAPAPRPASWNAIIVSQSPLPGHRIAKGEPIRVGAIPRAFAER